MYKKVKLIDNFKKNITEIVDTMLCFEFEMNLGDGTWRKHDGCWGRVLEKCGFQNSCRLRKYLYMMDMQTGNVCKMCTTKEGTRKSQAKKER